MIVRIVQMTFKEENIDLFLEIFQNSKNAIRQFEGCTELILYQDASDSRIFFTYSIWELEDHLNKYRTSALFENTWANTKVLFDSKPKAWTLKKAPNNQRQNLIH